MQIYSGKILLENFGNIIIETAQQQISGINAIARHLTSQNQIHHAIFPPAKRSGDADLCLAQRANEYFNYLCPIANEASAARREKPPAQMSCKRQTVAAHSAKVHNDLDGNFQPRYQVDAEEHIMPNFSEAAFREVQHRCNNDLQMVAALCSLTAARQDDPRLRDAIREISNRVNILVRARKGMGDSKKQTLGDMLRLVAEGLKAMAEPHGVKVDLEIPDQLPQLSDDATTAASIAVNELATNALKHAFKEYAGGTVRISVEYRETNHSCVISVEDDGIPFIPPADDPRERRRGIGLDLARRSLAAQGGMLILPAGESKRFEIRLPCQAQVAAA